MQWPRLGQGAKTRPLERRALRRDMRKGPAGGSPGRSGAHLTSVTSTLALDLAATIEPSPNIGRMFMTRSRASRRKRVPKENASKVQKAAIFIGI